MDQSVITKLSKPRRKPVDLPSKATKTDHVGQNTTSQQLDVTSLISRLEVWHLAETAPDPSAAEKFINIAELRIMLYNGMANSASNPVRSFSEFFLASKTVYAEAETEGVKFRIKYIEAEEAKWSRFYGDNFFIGRPHGFRDLNTATVKLFREIFRGIDTGDCKTSFECNYGRFRAQCVL
ncbi:hypothetical protein BU25DRAFT_459439 [Macroventuria anomochaeta]|uniref:Uncharacterized protein n=1 Tax=Macroventuria anomochaeta TaxID=301207 RepID=A0ACB6RWE8_9PLEO|nr:uncharacterized protein BU25DRAFT_459439 [Macroventuria anomochaeta]KAF2626295.1 hypothetical protein BU25DRAFT_459439 [Macroventuria anomochaeta]